MLKIALQTPLLGSFIQVGYCAKTPDHDHDHGGSNTIGGSTQVKRKIETRRLAIVYHDNHII